MLVPSRLSTLLAPQDKSEVAAIKTSTASFFIAFLGAGISAILLVGAKDIAPPMFDPVGSAAVPIACAVTLLMLGVGVLVQTWQERDRLPVSESGRTGSTRMATLGLLALMIVYLLVMHMGVRFSVATSGFVALSIPLICQRLIVLPLAVPIAIILGFGAEWLFTSVFFIDLPGTR